MELIIPKELKATNDVSDISVLPNEELSRKINQDYNNRTPISKISRPLLKTQENNNNDENFETNSNITNDLLQVRKYKLKEIKKKIYDENNNNENRTKPKNKLLLPLPEQKTKGVKRENIFKPKIIINKKEKKERFDRNGIIISKSNRRKVHITFIDFIGDNSLTEEIKIESFKKYNVIVGIPKEDKYIGPVRKNCQCCAVF